MADLSFQWMIENSQRHKSLIYINTWEKILMFQVKSWLKSKYNYTSCETQNQNQISNISNI